MNDRYEELWKEFEDPEYRVIYSEAQLDSLIATQLKVVREQRGYTQSELAQAAGMLQSRISTMEDVDYSSWSIKTLKRLAAALECALQVRLVPYESVIDAATTISERRLRVATLDDSKRARDRHGIGAGTAGLGIQVATSSLRPGVLTQSSTSVDVTRVSTNQGAYIGEERQFQASTAAAYR